MKNTAIITSLLLSQAMSWHDASAFVPPSSSSRKVVASIQQQCDVGAATTFFGRRQRSFSAINSNSSINSSKLMASSSNSDSDDSTTSSSSTAPVASTTEIISKAPTLNGKMVLPTKAMTAGLKGHKVPAVYAILSSNYKRGVGTDGWEHVQHVSITKDLASDISYFLGQKGSDAVAHIRALSFSYPQKATMEDFARGWKVKVVEAGGVGGGDGWGMVPPNGDGGGGDVAAVPPTATATTTVTTEGSSTIITVGDDYEFDEDDEDMDEDDLDDYLQMMAESRAAVSSSSTPAPDAPPLFQDNTGLSNIVSLAPPKSANDEEEDDAIISPFDASVDAASAAVQSTFDNEELELNIENVDKVLDEVRPYLISDGGNVSVQKVETPTDGGDVYLLLEGACGSCASSTVTMKMGIERVLKEKFGDRLGQVIQVDPDEDEDGNGGGKPKELTMEAVQEEVNRISTAIVAMGGVVRVVGVDPIGEVEIDFRGPNRVRKGLELALLDVEFVKHVKFVSE